jgi:hypothetical protein
MPELPGIFPAHIGGITLGGKGVQRLIQIKQLK